MSGTDTLPDLKNFGARLAEMVGLREAPPSVLGGRALEVPDLEPEALLDGPVVDPKAARALLGGVLIWLDADARARPLLDTLGTAEASYWMAVSFRKEGDTGSSNYWWHRTGRHPVFEPLAAEAERLLEGQEGPLAEYRERIVRRGWDTGNFVELTRRARENITGGAAWEPVLTAVQRAEMLLLLERCARLALGR